MSEFGNLTTYDDIIAPEEWLCRACGRPYSAHTCVEGYQRERYPFVAMLRVRNEGRWLAEVLESIRPLVAWTFILDDRSTDDTAEIAARFENTTVYPTPFTGLNESRDKNWLLDQIMRQCEPGWILCIDGDEVLEYAGADIIRATCAANPDCYAFALKIAFMWGDRNHVRVDRIYGDFWRPSLFRPYIPRLNTPDDLATARECRFKATPWGRHRGADQPNLHCSSVPQRFIHGRKLCPARLKHYGYMYREDRVRKLDYYTSVDWRNEAEDCYRHMCQGDNPRLAELPKTQELLGAGLIAHADVAYITNTPAEAALVHAGPLQVVPWDEGTAWEPTQWARQQHGG